MTAIVSTKRFGFLAGGFWIEFQRKDMGFHFVGVLRMKKPKKQNNQKVKEEI